MKFIETYKMLSQKNINHIILIRKGVFFTALGKDAVFLSKKIGLKVKCACKGICEVGFPVKAVEKYIVDLSFAGYPFILYEYSKNGFENNRTIRYRQLFACDGNRNIDEERVNIGCEKCKNRISYDMSNLEDTIKQIGNLIGKESGENEKE